MFGRLYHQFCGFLGLVRHEQALMIAAAIDSFEYFSDFQESIEQFGWFDHMPRPVDGNLG